MKKYVKATATDMYKRYMIEFQQTGEGIHRVFAHDENEVKQMYNKYKDGYGFRVFEIEYVGFLNNNGDIVKE